jgi:hypothetical protein
VLGGIITGDENYAIVAAVGFPLLITVASIFGGFARKRRAAPLTAPARPPGIISTMPGVAPPAQQEAILNPPSTALPSAGVVLNGQPVAPAKPALAQGGASGRFAWNLLSILTIAAGAALMLIPAYQTIGWIAGDIAAGRPFDGRDMTVGIHPQDAFDELVDVMGGTEVVSINFYDHYITVSAPTTPGARTTDRYEWKYGHASRIGPDYSQPSDIDAELFDAGDIDMDLVGVLTRQSIEDSGLTDLDGVYPAIRRWADEEPQISITLSNPYFDASYTYSLTGELIQRSGTAFD